MPFGCDEILVGSMRKQFVKKANGASLAEIGLLFGLIAVLLISAISETGEKVSNLFEVGGNALNNAVKAAQNGAIPDEEGRYASCKEWVDSGESEFVNNGVNPIYVGGAADPIDVYCQNGLTLIIAQFEADPVLNWNEGRQLDYDPALTTNASFALNMAEIPNHSKVYFGQELGAPLYCLEAQYSTGPLSGSTLYSSCDSAAQTFYMHRTPANYYDQHNPDDPNTYSGGGWNNSLAIEQHTNIAGTVTAGDDYNWGFSPRHALTTHRGYSFAGSKLRDAANPEAWTVWVE